MCPSRPFDAPLRCHTCPAPPQVLAELLTYSPQVREQYKAEATAPAVVAAVAGRRPASFGAAWLLCEGLLALEDGKGTPISGPIRACAVALEMCPVGGWQGSRVKVPRLGGGLGIWGRGFRIRDLGLRVQDQGSGVEGPRSGIWG